MQGKDPLFRFPLRFLGPFSIFANNFFFAPVPSLFLVSFFFPSPPPNHHDTFLSTNFFHLDIFRVTRGFISQQISSESQLLRWVRERASFCRCSSFWMLSFSRKRKRGLKDGRTGQTDFFFFSECASGRDDNNIRGHWERNRDEDETSTPFPSRR